MHDPEPLLLRFDQFVLDEGNARLTHAGRPLAIAPKTFAVLCALARQPGRLVKKGELLDAVWGHRHVSESVLKSTISELRAALSDDARQPRFIETASRLGYRFIGAALNPPSAPAPVLVAAAPVASAAIADEQSAMIGRTEALARLHAAWGAASAGRRQVFWITGEAGIGKTTLIDHFVSALGPVPQARGQCVEHYGAGEPYLPVLEALSALCRVDSGLTPLLRSIAPTWLIQLPWLCGEAEREALRRELSGVGQERMLRELGELLDRQTRQQPLLLITEDLHWSDHATIRLIDHIARRRDPARLMWLASFRLAEVIAEDHPLKALRHELRLHRLCDECALDPFSEQEVAAYIDGRFPQRRVSEGFARTLHARTDGLPLFVVNVIDDLEAQGALERNDADAQRIVPSAALQVPENLAGVIEKQVSRLAPEQCALLEAASVCGVEFRPDTVADVMQRDLDWVLERCDELARRHHWLASPAIGSGPDGSLDARYAFRHALYRHVFYQRIGAVKRAQLHRRAAVSLERRRADGLAVTAAELASHYELSHEPVQALRHYAGAAESALRHFAPIEAIALTAHALELLPRSPGGDTRDALEVTLCALRGVAAAQRFGVSALETRQAFERALALLDTQQRHPLRSMVMHGLGLVLLVRGEYAESRALGEHILALSTEQNDRMLLLCACNLLGQVSALQGDQPQARIWLERGVTAADGIDDDQLQAAFIVDPVVTMYAAFTIPLLHLGLADQARSRIEAAHARARQLGQPMAQMVACWFNALLEVRLRNPQRVAALADEMRAVVEDSALAQGEGPSRWYRGWADAQLGAPRAAYRLIRDAYAHNSGLGMLSGGSEVLGYAVEALVLAGDWAQAQAQLDEAMRIAGQLEERVYVTQLLLLQGRIALGRADATAAREAMQAALLEARAQQAIWLELIAAVALCELDSATHDDRATLAEVRARICEGLDSALVAAADALLAAAPSA